MGYLGRRIGKSQDTATDSGSGGGGGLLDLFSNGYFQRQGNIYNAPGVISQGLTATGGVISDYVSGPTVYRAHIFTSSGTFSVSALASDPNIPNNVDYLVVGGGGGGGNSNGGGGGAGSVVYKTGQLVSAQSYTITIGGGAVGEYRSNTTHVTASGTPSSIPGLSVTATGGGSGGNGNGPGPWAPGRGGFGSGGGGSTNAGAGGPGSPAFPGSAPYVSPPTGWASSGGTGSPPVGAGGGGGGAGGVGKNHNDGTYRSGGGSGMTIPAVTVAGYELKVGGGGGGGGPAPGGTSGGAAQDNPLATAAGGAGVISGSSPSPGKTATASTGGGGGGGGAYPASDGGNGGSGIVVVRYQIAQLTATAKATGGAISYYDGMTIHTFTSSGTFATEPNWTSTNVEYVVVGGGGAGGRVVGGGGGAGGYITGTTPIGAHPVSTTIQIGAGGNFAPLRGISGTPSYFGTPLTAYGGGSGGSDSAAPEFGGNNGGSGGGASTQPGAPYIGAGDRQTDTSTPAPITPQGFPGGGGSTDAAYIALAGGGGGAGGAGQNGDGPWLPGRNSGNGGIGKQIPATFHNPASSPGPTGGGLGAPGPTATNVSGGTPGKFWFAGGGGGGGDNRPAGNGNNPPHNGGYGGSGPGGGGPYAGGGKGEDGSERGGFGITNTGGGGGGGAHPSGSPSGTGAGSGGSGIVLIAYPS
jgi:hypothetical protein